MQSSILSVSISIIRCSLRIEAYRFVLLFGRWSLRTVGFEEQDGLSGDAAADVRQGEPQGGESGGLEVAAGGFGRRIAEQVEAFEVRAAIADGFCGPEHGQIVGLEADELAADSLACDGVGAADEPAERAGAAVNGALAVHCEDAVDDGQGGGQGFVYFDQERAEVEGVAAFAEMPEGFVLAADAAEHVFDGEGGDELLVRFEFGEVDDDVDIECAGAEADLDIELLQPEPSGIVELKDGDAQAIERLIEAEGFDAGADVAPGGRVGHEGAGAVVLEQACEGEQDGGVRLCGVPAGAGGDEVGLEQNAVARFDEAIEAAEQFDVTAQRCGDASIVVVGQAGQRYGGTGHGSGAIVRWCK